MRIPSLVAIGATATIVILVAQTPAPTRAPRPTEPPHHRASEVGWNLAPSDQQYAAIDGQHLKEYVEQLCAISRRYRDAGHQFWGRITGTEADAENAKWMLDKFRQIGLSDVHEQPLDLPPQWMPQSWSVVATANGKTLSLDTAQPTYLSGGHAFAGMDLEAVYVGLASDADLISRATCAVKRSSSIAPISLRATRPSPTTPSSASANAARPQSS